MPVVLNVAEKPSVAREVSRILNNGRAPGSTSLHGCVPRLTTRDAAQRTALRPRRRAVRPGCSTPAPTLLTALPPFRSAPPARRSARYNPVHMFDCTIQNTPCQMRFTSITGARPATRGEAGPRARVSRVARRASEPPRGRAGHLLDYDFGPTHRQWRSCPEGELIDTSKAFIKASVRKDCEALETLLKAEARGAQWLILWLDCDREGEAICHEARARSLPRPEGRCAALR